MERYPAIKLLTEAFDAYGIKYFITENVQGQEVHVLFGIKNGPLVDVRYISLNRTGGDITVRINNLVNAVPHEKRIKVLETINILNNKYRFLRFYMDPDNNVHVQYDFLANTANNCLGEMAFEIFVRTMQILNAGYMMIAKELYAADDQQPEKTFDPEEKDFMKLLEKNHDKINITISKTDLSEKKEE